MRARMYFVNERSKESRTRFGGLTPRDAKMLAHCCDSSRSPPPSLSSLLSHYSSRMTLVHFFVDSPKRTPTAAVVDLEPMLNLHSQSHTSPEH
jgi:hypothetical protein